MDTKAAIRRALLDAIEWQKSIADSYNGRGPEAERALGLVKQYRAILKRRYGDDRTAQEIASEGGTSISIFDIK